MNLPTTSPTPALTPAHTPAHSPLSFDYNQQLGAIQAQLANLRHPVSLPSPPHQVMPVDGIAGAEAMLRELPPGSSDIVAHRSEDIVYLIARDDNGAPLPIRTAKLEWIDTRDDPTGYVTKRDLEDLKADLMTMFTNKEATE